MFLWPLLPRNYLLKFAIFFIFCSFAHNNMVNKWKNIRKSIFRKFHSQSQNRKSRSVTKLGLPVSACHAKNWLRKQFTQLSKCRVNSSQRRYTRWSTHHTILGDIRVWRVDRVTSWLAPFLIPIAQPTVSKHANINPKPHPYLTLIITLTLLTPISLLNPTKPYKP